MTNFIEIWHPATETTFGRWERLPKKFSTRHEAEQYANRTPAIFNRTWRVVKAKKVPPVAPKMEASGELTKE